MTNRYRALVHPLYDTHKQPGKEFRGYRWADSVNDAWRLLKREFPYPKFLVDQPVLDAISSGSGASFVPLELSPEEIERQRVARRSAIKSEGSMSKDRLTEAQGQVSRTLGPYHETVSESLKPECTKDILAIGRWFAEQIADENHASKSYSMAALKLGSTAWTSKSQSSGLVTSTSPIYKVYNFSEKLNQIAQDEHRHSLVLKEIVNYINEKCAGRPIYASEQSGMRIDPRLK